MTAGHAESHTAATLAAWRRTAHAATVTGTRATTKGHGGIRTVEIGNTVIRLPVLAHLSEGETTTLADILERGGITPDHLTTAADAAAASNRDPWQTWDGSPAVLVSQPQTEAGIVGDIVFVADYGISLPHSCDEWEIAQSADRAVALAQLDRFIAELVRAREQLASSPDPTGERLGDGN